eukprot:363697-Chlamydomonas_euryale.AAC.1
MNLGRESAGRHASCAMHWLARTSDLPVDLPVELLQTFLRTLLWTFPWTCHTWPGSWTLGTGLKPWLQARRAAASALAARQMGTAHRHASVQQHTSHPAGSAAPTVGPSMPPAGRGLADRFVSECVHIVYTCVHVYMCTAEHATGRENLPWRVCVFAGR